MKRDDEVLLAQIITGTNRDQLFARDRRQFKIGRDISGLERHGSSDCKRDRKVRGERSECKGKTDGFNPAIGVDLCNLTSDL